MQRQHHLAHQRVAEGEGEDRGGREDEGVGQAARRTPADAQPAPVRRRQRGRLQGRWCARSSSVTSLAPLLSRGVGRSGDQPSCSVIFSSAACASSVTSPPLAMSTNRSSRTREPSTCAQPGRGRRELGVGARGDGGLRELVVAELARERLLRRRQPGLDHQLLVVVAQHQADDVLGQVLVLRLGRDRDVRAAEEHRGGLAVAAREGEDADVRHHVGAAGLLVLDQAR